MNLVVWTLAVPLVTAVIGSVGIPRRAAEAVLAAGLSLTFALCLATAGQFLLLPLAVICRP